MKKFITLTIAFMISSAPLCAQDIPLSKILVAKEGWHEVAKPFPGVTYLSSIPSGIILIFQDKFTGYIETNGKVEPANDSVFKAAVADQKHVRGFSTDGSRNWIWETKPVKLKGLKSPSCITIWPDEGHLVIGEADGAYLWAVRIEKDGSLGPGDRYYSLRTKPNEKMHVTAMTMDAGYLLYACTPLGIQVFDPTGRLCGVIAAPSKETMTAITIGGEKADTLFVAVGDKIYARKIQGRAAYTLKKEK